MKCTVVKEKLLDMVEGELEAEETRQVRQHLEECELCREEADCLRAGLNGIRDAVPLQVGSGPHLTPSRREAALKAARRERKKTRLVTWRKFAGAAAAAMLLVSAFFLGQDFFGGRNQPERTTTVRAPRSIPTQRAPAGRFEAQRGGGIRTVTAGNGGQGARSAGKVRRPAQPKNMMYNQPPEVEVPVQNAYYEPRKERYWW